MAAIKHTLETDDATGDFYPFAKVHENNNVSDIKKRAEKQSLGQVPTAAVRMLKNIDDARKDYAKLPLRRFIMKVSGFANDSFNKLWETKKETLELTDDSRLQMQSDATKTDGTYAEAVQKLNEATGEMLNQDAVDIDISISKYMKHRGNLLSSPTVKGYVFLTPMAYAHLMEAHELIQNHVNIQVDLDKLIVEPSLSTYFARFVATRLQISRFLAGKYYQIGSNYQRLLQVQQRLMQFFKNKLKNTQQAAYINEFNTHSMLV